MIISRTPFRISFFGGSTDIKEFYSREEFGCVISAAIDKYFYTMLNKRLDNKIRLVYSKLEEADNAQDIRHEFARECLKLLEIDKGIEIIISSDIPARGSGLGTSSSTTVGLLNILSEYQKTIYSKEYLALTAYKIEHDILEAPCGKQDQYAAAYGGLNYIQFNSDETVQVDPIKIDPAKRRELEDSLMLFYTGITRRSTKAATRVAQNIPKRISILREIKEQALLMKQRLETNFTIEEFGWDLDLEWDLKQKTASITTPTINKIYMKAVDAGIYGGKLCGAGLGGFMLFCCDPDRQDKLRKALYNLKEFKIKFDDVGSTILYNSWG